MTQTRLKPLCGAIFAIATSVLPANMLLADEKLDAATAYIESTLEDMDMAAMIENMYVPIIAQFQKSGETVTPEQIEQIDALYKGRFTEPMTEIMRAQSGIMAEVFTLEEINALASFYQTDLGKAAIVKMPQLMERQMPLVMQMVEQEMGTLLPELMGILQPAQ